MKVNIPARSTERRRSNLQLRIASHLPSNWEESFERMHHMRIRASSASEAVSITRGPTVTPRGVCLVDCTGSLSHQSRQQLGRVWQLGLNPALQREPETQLPSGGLPIIPAMLAITHTHTVTSGSHHDLITDPNLSWSEQRPSATERVDNFQSTRVYSYTLPLLNPLTTKHLVSTAAAPTAVSAVMFILTSSS